MVRRFYLECVMSHPHLPGLLIDSERVYTAVVGRLHFQLTVITWDHNSYAGNILAKYGKEFTLEMKSRIMGRRM